MNRAKLEENKNFIVTAIFVIAIILMYILDKLNPELFNSLFILKSSNLSNVLPWQFLTYAFVFNNESPLFFFFTVMIFMWFSSRLESIWGRFYIFLYIITTILLKSISSFIFGPLPVMGDSSLYLALMVAFGFNFQDEKIYLFFILPIRVKILAIISLIFVGFNIVASIYYIFAPPQDIGLYRSGLFNVPYGVGNLITTIASYISILIFYKKIFPYNSRILKIKRQVEENIQEVAEKIGTTQKIIQNNKYYELLKKERENLSELDLEILNKIEENPKICDEGDFEPESEYCRLCDLYKNCVKRSLERD